MNLLDVMENVKRYFEENLQAYTVMKIRKKSYHPDDSHLYMVSAKKSDGTYAVWTGWNESTHSLNYGHYGLKSEESCEQIFNEYFYSGN